MLPDLCIGMSEDSFHTSGKTPCSRDRLNSRQTGGPSTSAHFLMKTGGSLSGPGPFEASTAFSELMISATENVGRGKLISNDGSESRSSVESGRGSVLYSVH